MQHLITTTIAHYELLRHIARGGMADIYLACDTETGQQVAIKLVHNNNEYCARFRQEADTLAMLDHKHILPVYNYGEHDGWCYLAMPYIEHGTLNDRLARGPLSPEHAGELLTQLASALQYAHDHGIVHRDIKPSNVLLKDGRHVYLADFGLVKRVGLNTKLTLSGYLIGTPDYMAPELAEDEATPLSDIYALGVLLYQMLTGQLPFHGTSPINIFLKHLSDEPASLSLLNPAIPPAIEQIVLRAMAKNPWHRFASAYELAQSYQLALTNGLVVPEDQVTLDLLPPDTKRAGNTWRIALAGLALLVCMAVVLGLSASLPGIQTPHAQSNNRLEKMQHISTSIPIPTSSPTTDQQQQNQTSATPNTPISEHGSFQAAPTPLPTTETTVKDKDKENASKKKAKDPEE